MHEVRTFGLRLTNNDVLTIRDNGVGISQVTPKIFDKGYSGYNGRLNANSSGIGLFIVKHISQHLHHYVDVQSG